MPGVTRTTACRRNTRVRRIAEKHLQTFDLLNESLPKVVDQVAHVSNINSFTTSIKIDIIVFLHYIYKPSGLAHFRFSIFPVFGHRISCHETGSIVAPAAYRRHSGDFQNCVTMINPPVSLVANITPRSFRAVVM